MTEQLNIAKEFSPVPMGLSRADGKHSAEAFREDVLRPRLLRAIRNNDILQVDFDGMAVLNVAFLEQAFGGLVRGDRSIPAEDAINALSFSPEDDYMAYFYRQLKRLMRDEEIRAAQ